MPALNDETELLITSGESGFSIGRVYINTPMPANFNEKYSPHCIELLQQR